MFTTKSPIRPEPATEPGGPPAEGRPAPAEIAVLLIGQGSTKSPRPNETLSQIAVRLVTEGRAAEATSATLLGGPSPPQRLAVLRSRQVFVVPMLMCDGLLCREVIPQMLGLTKGQSRIGDRIVHLCPPIGMHPMIADLIADHATRALADSGLNPADVTLLLIGHGSTRHRESANATELQAERVRLWSSWGRVETAFIGQPPYLSDALKTLPGPLIGIALFAARGNHVVADIEKQFQKYGTTDVRLLGAIGEHPDITNVIARMIEDQRHSCPGLPRPISCYIWK
jgi:sirohydrochlorin ferrochelatase